MRRKQLPTVPQAHTAIFLRQLLSNLSQPIHVFGYDPRRREIFILAGVREDLEILIFEDGEWDFN